MTAPDSRRRYGAEVVAQRWLAKSEARRRVHGGGKRRAGMTAERADILLVVNALWVGAFGHALARLSCSRQLK